MGDVLARVSTRFPDAPREQIRTMVKLVHLEYEGRPIREFVPVLVEREVVNTLRMVHDVTS